MNWTDEIRHDISTIQSTPHDLKKFGLTIGGVFLLFCGAAFWKGWWGGITIITFGSFGIFLVISGILFPQSLRGIHRWWMSFAVILGSIVSRFILFVVFFSIVSVISLLARIIGKKFYIAHTDRQKSSYWIRRDQSKKINYEKMS